jgi:hypothetical protein
MARANPVEYLIHGDWLDTILPDFVLAFAFFTAVVYAVLGRRMGHQRPAIAASAALGAALAAGLVTWEQYNDLSIRHLGPIAAGFGLIILAGVIYQSIRGIGGSWAGAAIAVGACLLVGWTIGIDWPARPEIVQTVMVVTLTVGTLAFMLHRNGALAHVPRGPVGFAEIRHDMSDIEEDHRISDQVASGLRRVRKGAADLWQRPDRADDVMLQLKRMLPAEGWLTQRMARLRARAFQIKRGHVARIEVLRDHTKDLPTKAKIRISRELQSRFKVLKLDERIERLDKLVTQNERVVRELTRQAQAHLAASEFQKLNEVVATAEKTQQRCSKVFDLIERTEKKLLATAMQAAKQANEVSRA